MKNIKVYEEFINDDDLEYEDEEDNSDFIPFDDFKQFLIDNNCLYEYCENFEKFINKISGDISKRINYIFSVKYDIINRSFSWSKTPEGYEYWSGLDKEWRKYNR